MTNEELERYKEELEKDELLNFALAQKTERKKIIEAVKEALKIEHGEEMRCGEDIKHSWYLFHALKMLAFNLEAKAVIVDAEPPPSGVPGKGFFSGIRILPRNFKPGDELRKLAKELEADGLRILNSVRLKDDADPMATPLTLFNMGRVKNFLPTLLNDNERYSYLLKLKQAYLNADRRGRVWVDRDKTEFKTNQRFNLALETEIALYKEILGPGVSIAQQKPKKEKRGNGGTQYQNLLVMHYLLKYAKADMNNTQKAKFISFLTGWSENTLRQQLSNPHGRQDENGIAWDKDMRIVRDYFEKLGLHEAARMVENDLESKK